MARKKDSPQKAAIREMMHDYLKDNDISIKSGGDVNAVMRDMMSILLEGLWTKSLMKNLDILSMITATKTPITAETGIPARPCIPAMEIW